VTNALAYNTAVFITVIILDNTRVLRVFVSAINFQSGLIRPEPATKRMERSDKHASLSMPLRYYDEKSFIISTSAELPTLMKATPPKEGTRR
jgi:hypothetical protein